MIKHWATKLENRLVDGKLQDVEVPYYILQVETGIEYVEAIDVIPCRYTYKETDREYIDEREKELERRKAELAELEKQNRLR